MSPQDIRLQEAKDTLQENLSYLIRDARDYDNGDFQAIKRSAGTIRTLFYDTKNSTSLLKFLKLKDALVMKSYVQHIDKEVINYSDIYFVRYKDRRTKAKYYDTFIFYPTADSKVSTLSVEQWWNENIITFNDKNQGKDSSLTRKDLIKVIANKEGIAHFDPSMNGKKPRKYIGFKRGYTGFHVESINNPVLFHRLIGGECSPGKQDIYGVDIHLAFMRQIVHETLISLIPATKSNLVYEPDFKHNFSQRLNQEIWHVNATHK